jgi:hypothetical protein
MVVAERVRDPERGLDKNLLKSLPPLHRVMYVLGFAVFASQIFEAVFVLVGRTAFRHADAMDLREITPFSMYAHKQPVSALVKELSQKAQIKPELASRISALVGDRNILVHRIVFGEQQLNAELIAHGEKTEFKHLVEQLGGASALSSDPFAQHAALVETSKRVYRESFRLAMELLNVFTEYCERFPEAAAFVAQYKDEFARARRDLESLPGFERAPN